MTDELTESAIVAALVARGVPRASAMKTARAAVAARDRYDKPQLPARVPFSEVVRISELTFSVPAQPRVASSSCDANQRSQGDRLTPGNSRPTFSGSESTSKLPLSLSQVKRGAPPSSRKAPPSHGRSKEVPWPLVSAWFTHNAIPEPKREYRFAPPRRFRMDFAWPEQMVGLEVDGGVWTSGRHTRGSGWTTDTEKLNLAVSMGWRMLRTTPTDFLTHDTAATIKAALEHYRCLTPAP